MANDDQMDIRDRLFKLHSQIGGIIGETGNRIVFSGEAHLGDDLIKMSVDVHETMADVIAEIFQSRGLAMCGYCDRVTKHKHMHDTAHGIPETHMAGSERYVCTVCSFTIRKEDAIGLNAHLKFILD